MQKQDLSIRDFKRNFRNKLIDYTGLYLIGILSFGYLLLYRAFAKLHIDLPFIKAPIFIGDIVFIICFGLFFLKWLINPKNLNIFTYLFLFYFGFMVTKTLWGYFYCGPLALRHSVLFYYPVFSVFTFSFFRNDFFEPKKNLFFIFVLFFVFKFFEYHPYFTLTCLSLILVLINNRPEKPLRYILYFILLLVLPYKAIFGTSRTFITGNVFALVYAGIGLLIILKIKRLYKIILFLVFVISVIYGILTLSNLTEVRSLIGFDELVNRYNQMVKIMPVRALHFIEPKLEVRLFNERRNTIGSLFFSDVENKIKSNRSSMQEVKTALPVTGAMRASNIVLEKKRANDDMSPELSGVQKVKTAVPVAGAMRVSNIAGVQKVKTNAPVVSVKQQAASIILKVKRTSDSSIDEDRGVDVPYANSLFRIFIWKDVLKELRNKHPLLGFDFGKPFRSRTLEVLNWAASEWKADGWICMHNSYIDIIYRSGVIGIVFIVSILILLFNFTAVSLRNRSLGGIILTGALINWFVAANFLEILEMPYSAIPLWSLFGLTFAYLFKNKTA